MKIDAKTLRRLAQDEEDARKRTRLLAMAHIKDGKSVEEAARMTGMGRATLYRWLARVEEEGPAGLCDRPRSGRPRKLGEAERAAVRAWLKEAESRQGTIEGYTEADEIPG